MDYDFDYIKELNELPECQSVLVIVKKLRNARMSSHAITLHKLEKVGWIAIDIVQDFSRFVIQDGPSNESDLEYFNISNYF
jgi:hypothetical protein